MEWSESHLGGGSNAAEAARGTAEDLGLCFTQQQSGGSPAEQFSPMASE